MPRERHQASKLQKTESKTPRWFVRVRIDIINSQGELTRQLKRIYLGPVKTVPVREAQKRGKKLLETLNSADHVITSQIPFGDLLDVYEKRHVLRDGILAASTQQKYLNHIRNHIRPAFAELKLYEIDTPRIEAFLDGKAKPTEHGPGLSWATRTDLRNILSGVFTKAADWGYFEDRNPVERVSVGRKRAVREKRKLTDTQQRRLLAALPEDVRLIVEVALFLTLRISEVLGVQEKHLDFRSGLLSVEQRYYRGNLDVVKTERANRAIPMGFLADKLRPLMTGDPERHVFSVQTKRGECRDDRDINQYFLRPAAKALGIYYPGFGFHTFRREAITDLNAELGTTQSMRASGHSKVDTSLLYTLADRERQEAAVRRHQERIWGLKPNGPVQ